MSLRLQNEPSLRLTVGSRPQEKKLLLLFHLQRKKRILSPLDQMKEEVMQIVVHAIILVGVIVKQQVTFCFLFWYCFKQLIAFKDSNMFNILLKKNCFIVCPLLIPFKGIAFYGLSKFFNDICGIFQQKLYGHFFFQSHSTGPSNSIHCISNTKSDPLSGKEYRVVENVNPWIVMETCSYIS